MKRLLLVGVVVALVPVVPATAHTFVQGPTRMYQVTDGPCVLNRTLLNGWHAEVRAISKKWTRAHGQCTVHDQVPASDLRIMVRFQKSSTKGPVFTWDRCRKTWGPVKNQQATEVLVADLRFNSRSMERFLCGTGWYRIKGYSWRWINGAYRGGAHSTFSQPHWIKL